MAKNTICLWYDKDAEAAARFYAETFPDSAVAPSFVHLETIRTASRETCWLLNSRSRVFPVLA